MQARTVKYIIRTSYADWRASSKPVTRAHGSESERSDRMKLAKTSGAMTAAIARKKCPTVETCNMAVFVAKISAATRAHRDLPRISRARTHGATRLRAANGQKYNSFSTRPHESPR